MVLRRACRHFIRCLENQFIHTEQGRDTVNVHELARYCNILYTSRYIYGLVAFDEVSESSGDREQLLWRSRDLSRWRSPLCRYRTSRSRRDLPLSSSCSHDERSCKSVTVTPLALYLSRVSRMGHNLQWPSPTNALATSIIASSGFTIDEKLSIRR